MKPTFSDKELQMIEHFGYAELAPHIEPLVMYRLLTHRAFILNDQTAFAAGLRRAMIAFDTGAKIYRMTPEWDALLGDLPMETIKP